MKKLLLLAFTVILTSSCIEERINGIPINIGDTQTFETKDYIIIYEIKGFNNFGQAKWEFKGIINKKDSL